MGRRTNTAVWMQKQSRWQIKVQKDGVRKTFYSCKPGRTGQRECNAKADAFLDGGVESRTAKVSEWYEKFLDKKKEITSVSNWRPMESRYRTWIKPAIGNRKIESLKPQQLQDIVDKAYAKGLSKKSLMSLCADIRAFYKFARKSGVTCVFPEDIQVPAGARKGEKTILKPEDIKVLFSVDESTINGKRVKDPYINAYRLQVLTGMRPSEIIGLRWENITEYSIQVQGGINIRGEHTKGKNENAVRAIALTDMMRAVLQSQGKKPLGSVFCISTEQTYRKRLRAYCESNGITVVTPYELRHTFVSVAQVLPEAIVKQIVGHSKSMDTFGVYGHVLQDQNAAAAAQLNTVFEGLSGQKR